MLKQLFLAHFEPMVTRFVLGPKMGKNGSKTRLSKSDPGPFGMLKQVFLAHFEPIGTVLAHG